MSIAVRRIALGGLLVLASACSSSPVNWIGQRTMSAGADSTLMLAPDGSLHADTLLAVAARITPPAKSICPGSLRLARSGGSLYAVWWTPRPDSSANLLLSRSLDGGRHWSAAAAVDTSDHGVTGCRRVAPSLAADSTTGYVHVTYGIVAPEGPGLFFAHSMDEGVTFHSPVAIVYGDRLGHTSVAADGDIVIVGFEDPNSVRPRVGLAISRTMGHIFEQRILPLSADVGAASAPLTAVRGRHVAVAWEQRASPSSPSALDVRVGTLR